ncbi:MAG TPA: hypothetical protein VGN63_13935 [Flavisolibacter sp.]|nr:hypothetical protein [Flavisolibacter sp.]
MFSTNGCNRYNEVVDAECNYICVPGGGYTGMEECTDFGERAERVKIVWEEERV